MNFGQAISNCFSNYATFSGRAPRSEYWYFCLFLLVGNICTLVADVLILGDMETQPINLIFYLATLLPALAVLARRLHDINKSGWWLLIILTGIGILLLIYWSLLSSKDEGNTF